jgi:hypothetical protein
MLYLYLSPNLSKHQFGGAVAAQSNLEALKSIQNCEVKAFTTNRWPADNVVPINCTKSRFATLLMNMMLFSASTLNLKGLFQLIHIIRDQRPNAIWFDSSCFGVIVAYVALFHPSIKTYVFFQNIEKNMAAMEVKRNKVFILKYPSIWLSEYLSIRYAYQCLAITHQVQKEILISRPSTRCVSISIGRADEYPASHSSSPVNEPYVLFVGSDFPPNVEALYYLNEKIAPKLVGVKIVALGSGIEKYRAQFKNLIIIGRVSSLSEYYVHAQKIVAPIFSGDGIKIKIAEAFMYGKTVVASSFAAIGYEAAPPLGLRVTDQVEEFISEVQVESLLFNPAIRAFWLEMLSQHALNKRVKVLMSQSDEYPEFKQG